ncbi:MAG: 50S ribosomal protein L1 [Armatimonadota bacterium]|nr:50S ribosomal protein L1 [Armatimonadota bacterium]
MRKTLKKVPHGKRYEAARSLGDRLTTHDPAEALALVKKSATAKFPETVDLAVRLGIDARQSDQNVRGITTLPHGTGKSRKVAVLAKGDALKAAEAAGADEVGSDELVAKIAGGYKGFDVLIATSEMAPTLAKIGRVLGPKTPNKKSGTLTDDVATAVAEIKQASRVEYRNDKAGIVHVAIGKVTFSDDQLIENLTAALNALVKAKPSGSKGRYILGVTVSSSMGPGFRIDPVVAAKTGGA